MLRNMDYGTVVLVWAALSAFTGLCHLAIYMLVFGG